MFDRLCLDGRSLVDAAYADRRSQLEKLDLNDGRWLTTPAWTDGTLLWEATAEQQLEGVVAKRLDSRYQPGRRTRSWVKAKHWQHATLSVIGWRSVRGRLTGLLVAADQPDGTMRYAGLGERGLTP